MTGRRTLSLRLSQSSELELYPEPAGGPGGTAPVTVKLHNAQALEAFQWGVCHESSLDLAEDGVQSLDDLAELDLEFLAVEIVEEGWSMAAATAPGETLPSGHYKMQRVTYDSHEIGNSQLTFCGELMEPSFTTAGGSDITPALEDATISIVSPFTFRAVSRSVGYQPDGGPATFVVEFMLSQEVLAGGSPTSLSALSIQAKHDDKLLTPVEIELGDVLQNLNGGDGPGLLSAHLETNEHGSGFFVTAIFDLFGGSLQFDTEQVVACVTYTTVDGALPESAQELTTTIDITDGIMSMLLDDTDHPHAPALVDGSLTFVPSPNHQFLRGDADGSGQVSAIGDATFLLRYGYLGGTKPPCLDAADVDDNGQVSPILDGISLLTWGFTGGEDPPSPGVENCDADPTVEDAVSCDQLLEGCL